MEKISPPRRITIRPYDFCDFKCIMCHLGRKPSGEKILGLEKWKDFINSLGALIPHKHQVYVDIAGGEPLHPRHLSNLALINHIKRQGFTTTLTTNGYYIDDEIARKIADSGLETLLISFDSLKPEIFNRIRNNREAFDRVMRAFEYLKKRCHHMRISINCLIMGLNLSGLNDLAVWANENLKDGFILFQAIVSPLGDQYSEDWYLKDKTKILFPISDEFQDVLDKLITLKKKGFWIDNSIRQLNLFRKYFENPGNFVKNFHCTIGNSFINAQNDGSCFLCYEMGPFCNFTKDNLYDSWFSSKKTEDIRKRIFRCQKNCHQLLNCNYEEEESKETEQPVKISRIFLLNSEGYETEYFLPDEKMVIRTEIRSETKLENIFFRINIFRQDNILVFGHNNNRIGKFLPLRKGKNQIEITLDKLNLQKGVYFIAIEIAEDETTQEKHYLDRMSEIFFFVKNLREKGAGIVSMPVTWQLNNSS